MEKRTAKIIKRVRGMRERRVRHQIKDWIAERAFRYIQWYCKQHLQFGSCNGCAFKENGHCLIRLREKYNPENCKYASETDMYDGWECGLNGGACLHWQYKKKSRKGLIYD